MFNVINSVSGAVVVSCSDLATAETMRDIVDTTPSTHEIVEVAVEPAE